MKISIVVAVYNTSKYLKQCLESVLNQTMSSDEYEVIIVNDCSTDNSMEVISEQIKGHDNVTVIDKKVNEMTFWSRVDGICAAKGDYIGFIDSDDWIEPDMYEVMFNKGVGSGADIVECGTIYEYEDGHKLMDDIREEKMISSVEVIKNYSERPVQLALYLRIFSRRVIDKFLADMYPYFNARREEYRIRVEDDLLYPLLVSCADNLLFISESFCHHRMERPDSNMDQISKNQVKQMETGIYRAKAGLVVMDFTKKQPQIYKYISQKQVEVMFSLLGRLIGSNIYTKEESAAILNELNNQFVDKKPGLSLKSRLRYVHLRLKTLYSFYTK